MLRKERPTSWPKSRNVEIRRRRNAVKIGKESLKCSSEQMQGLRTAIVDQEQVQPARSQPTRNWSASKKKSKPSKKRKSDMPMRWRQKSEYLWSRTWLPLKSDYLELWASFKGLVQMSSAHLNLLTPTRTVLSISENLSPHYLEQTSRYPQRRLTSFTRQ